jgi:hypothetical protein
MMLSRRKTRPDSRMLRLTPQQQDAAFAHCQTTSVRDAVPWLKDQFSVTIGKSALSAWLQQQRIKRSPAAGFAVLRGNLSRAP